MIEKITAKVTCWSTKLLSYAKRVQLIKSVLFAVQAYWSQIFLIPKKVIKSIEQICRTFLWTESVTVSKKAFVSWETICKPHAAGGLNIMDLCLWNRVAILKQLWNMARSKECLWIRWVHTYFIRSIHPRFKFVVWLAIHKRLATIDRLITKDLCIRLYIWLGYPRVIQDWKIEV
ncbi:hypothetical protein H5410_001413 [Solanum commersonii]|uniref:Reverse transcriptase zinc-binding domain-containing protein n=1 Tax=Solanum commersonii TaxID=4109 RepID=A0A9J6AYY7_SOLCO|nr:hypothetical protein H5410_001413 [Solanum commersonii]